MSVHKWRELSLIVIGSATCSDSQPSLANTMLSGGLLGLVLYRPFRSYSPTSPRLLELRAFRWLIPSTRRSHRFDSCWRQSLHRLLLRLWGSGIFSDFHRECARDCMLWSWHGLLGNDIIGPEVRFAQSRIVSTSVDTLCDDVNLDL